MIWISALQETVCGAAVTFWCIGSQRPNIKVSEFNKWQNLTEQQRCM